jgi:CheY-like chemotaxis protein
LELDLLWRFFQPNLPPPWRGLGAMTYPTKPSLLITDDDAGFRETLRSVFEPRFQTLLAGDGEEALRIVRTQPIHLVLVDMHMPRLTGLEVLRRMGQLQVRVPCILLSANLDEQLIRQARQANAFSVLSKPVSRQRITWTVEQAMQVTYSGHFGSDAAKPPFDDGGDQK